MLMEISSIFVFCCIRVWQTLRTLENEQSLAKGQQARCSLKRIHMKRLIYFKWNCEKSH